MERVSGALLDGLEMVIGDSKSQTAISLGRRESSTALLTALLELAEARGEGLSEARMRVYLRDLEAFDVRDVQVATRQLGAEERNRYEPKYPELGTVIARTKAAKLERIKPPVLGPCDVCDGTRMVPVERDGRRFMRDCECRITWNRLKSEREAELAGEAVAA